jgi:TDG/mug DNA glycosylase family protein
VDDVDAPAALLVDAVPQGDDLLDGGEDVGEGAVVDRALEGVEEEVDGEADIARHDLVGGLAQQRGRPGQPTDGGREAAAQPQPVDPLDGVVGRADLVGAREQRAGLADEAGLELGRRREAQPAGPVVGLGRQAAGGLPGAGREGGRADVRRHRRCRVEGGGDLLVGSERRAGEVPGAAGRSFREGRGQRPVGGPLGAAAGSVVRRRADQGVAEREVAVVAHEHAGVEGGPERVGSVPVGGQCAADAGHVAVGVGGDDHEGGARRRIEPVERQLGGPAPVVADRQRIGQRRPPGALRLVEQVGGLDEHQRVAATRRAEAVADVAAGDAGVDEQLVGQLVGEAADLDHRPEIRRRLAVGSARGDHRDVLELDLLGDVREDHARGEVDPRHVVDDEEDRRLLVGVRQQVARRHRHRERLHRAADVGEREGAPDRRGAGRGELVDPPEEPVEEPGQPGPRHLDLGLEPADPHDPQGQRLGERSPHDLVEHRRLAHAGVTHQRAGTTVAVDRGAHEGEQLGEDLVPAAQRRVPRAEERGWGRRCGRHRAGAVDAGGCLGRSKERSGRPACGRSGAEHLLACRRVGFTRAELDAFRDTEVPDLVGPGLRLLFVGINPGLWTAATQTHFAHPGNRFYPALRRAGVIERDIDRGTGMTDDDRAYLVGRGIGITNLVARATPRAAELTAEELRAGGARLLAFVAEHRPAVVAVAGVTAYRQAFAVPRATLGRQPADVAGAELWIVPNPSGLNAHETIDSLAAAYRAPAVAAGIVAS